MPKNKPGKYYVIDSINEYRLIEINFIGEDQPLYKIYKGSELVKHWRSDEDIYKLSDSQLLDSDDYNVFLNYVLTDNPDLETDIFGLPSDSKLGTNQSKIELTTSGTKLGSDDSDVHRQPKQKTAPKSKYSYGGGYWGNYQYQEPQETNGLAAGLKKSNTLVIHCEDESTEMLSQMYEGRGFDVLRDGSIAESEMHELLQCHDRIIMLGHGTPGGLINKQSSKGGRWTVIDERYVDDLKGKQMFVIWCMADAFFDRYHIGQGSFVTGNMPSEVWECRAAGCGDISTQLMLDNITYWSKLCSDVTERCLNGDVASSVDYIRREYIKKYGDHTVTHYNAVRTKVQGTTMQENEAQVKAIEDELNIHPAAVTSSETKYW